MADRMTGVAHGYTKPSPARYVPSCLASNGHMKVRYRSRAAANRARRELGGRLFIYEHSECAGWHLSSTPSRKARA